MNKKRYVIQFTTREVKLHHWRTDEVEALGIEDLRDKFEMICQICGDWTPNDREEFGNLDDALDAWDDLVSAIASDWDECSKILTIAKAELYTELWDEEFEEWIEPGMDNAYLCSWGEVR